MRDLSYPPHITLAVYETIDLSLLVTALSDTAREAKSLSLAFTSLGYFEGPPLVLWAKPSASNVLARAHAVVHSAINPASSRPHYRPGDWIPHCTLAMRVREECATEAVAFAAKPIEPFEVLFDRADCLSFPPVSLIESRMLRLEPWPGVR